MVKEKIWYTGRLRKIYIDREFVIEKDCRCILEECVVIINSALRFILFVMSFLLIGKHFLFYF